MVKRYKTENPEIYPGLIILQAKDEFHQSVVSFIDVREIPLDVQFRHPHGLKSTRVYMFNPIRTVTNSDNVPTRTP